jgi:hypothetical protein
LSSPLLAFAVAAAVGLLATAAGAADSRFTAAPGPLRVADEAAPIEASLYSLSSTFFDPVTAGRFLAAALAAAPGRRILVACDPAMCAALAAAAAPGAVDLLPSRLPFSPWPRDPMTFARDADGRVLLLARPNVQRGREADARLAPWLANALPADLDARSGGVRHAVAPWPFHGGQLLQADGVLWLTLHSVEPRANAILGLDRVPVESFGSPSGVERYARAARQAAAELGSFFGRQAVFAHALPAGTEDVTGPELFRRLAPGAGLDLDSYLTLLPGAGGAAGIALVGDLRAGDELLAAAPAASFVALQATYDLVAGGEALRSALRLAQGEARGRELADYLDTIAGHLRQRGLEVRRLPLLRVPTALLADRAGVEHRDFLLTWNNVVLEGGAGGLRAEGFASSWVPGDRAAERAFRDAGASLRLLPPLAHSIVLGGGYRCVSNHLRRDP